MEKSDVTLVEVEVKQGKTTKRLFIQTTLRNEGKEGFSITLSDGSSVWEGSLSEDNLDTFSSQRKMDFETYVEQTKAALSKGESSELCFEYHLTPTTDTNAQFVWKKHVVEDDIKFQLGSVKVKKSDQSAEKLCEILSSCVLRTARLQEQIRSLHSDNERLSMERQNALKRLDKCVTAKEALEIDLYSKFTAVLNSKKERIRKLEDNGTAGHFQDEEMRPSSRTSASPDPSRSPDTKQDRRENTVDQDEVDTDEEASPPKRQKNKIPGKVSTVLTRLSPETSLNLGDDEMEVVSKKEPAVRRPRRQPPAPKQTPSKPVLPRVSSGNAPSRSSARKTSLRKSGSENSNKSSDNLDPDDLLDNF